MAQTPQTFAEIVWASWELSQGVIRTLILSPLKPLFSRGILALTGDVAAMGERCPASLGPVEFPASSVQRGEPWHSTGASSRWVFHDDVRSVTLQPCELSSTYHKLNHQCYQGTHVCWQTLQAQILAVAQ